jgi:hypothetical protein
MQNVIKKSIDKAMKLGFKKESGDYSSKLRAFKDVSEVIKNAI